MPDCGCDYELVEDGAIQRKRWFHEPGCPHGDSSAATVDPRVRKDGLCAGANCRKPRTAHRNPASGKTQGAQKATRLNKKLWLYELYRDPFCSSRCARKYHGVVYQSDAAGDELTAARERAGQSAADRYRAGAL